MRILLIQLKRIGDLVLTAPALSALRATYPQAEIALAVAPTSAPLLSLLPQINTGIVLGRGRGFRPWQQILTGPWDLCFDLTGSDRSTLATAISRAKKRLTFASIQRSKVRATCFTHLVDSSVRDRHTIDHYLDLVATPDSPTHPTTEPLLSLDSATRSAASSALAKLGILGPFAVIHAGTARPEKNWLPDRWAQVAKHLHQTHGLISVLTGGSDPAEHAHLAEIISHAPNAVVSLAGQLDLPTFTALLAQATICLSCDTAAVHLASAFHTPQIALFGPTNPFHWRPRHAAVQILSATHPSAPLTTFHPKMPGAPTDQISTTLVIDAIAPLHPLASI